MATKAKAKTARPSRAKGKSLERPLPPAKQLLTPEEERLRDSDQTMRLDGTTPRHTEPLGPPAPGQAGRPGPERRVNPTNRNVRPVIEKSEEELADERKARGRKIRVTAVKMGYIDHVRRRPGDVFDVYENEFSDKWMQVVDGSTPPKTTGAQASLTAAREEHLRNVAEKKAGKSTGDRAVV